jgi:hypothetical protein
MLRLVFSITMSDRIMLSPDFICQAGIPDPVLAAISFLHRFADEREHGDPIPSVSGG